MIELENHNGFKVAVDPDHVAAVVERGPNRVGLRLDHPDVVVVKGKYGDVLKMVRDGKKTNFLPIQT